MSKKSLFNTLEFKVKIPIIIVLVIFISFFSVYFYLDFYAKGLIIPLDVEDEFYSQKFDTREKKIFLIGSSYVARINGTTVQTEIDKLGYDNYVFYNLGISGDSVIKRQKSIDKVIASKPEIVIYGVSLPDFGYTLEKTKSKLNPTEQTQETLKNTDTHVLLDPKQTIENWVLSESFFDSLTTLPNPKLVTLTLLKKTTDNEKIVLYPKYADKPFYKGPKIATTITSDTQLIKYASQYEFHDLSEDIRIHDKIDTLRNIISKFQNNQIKVVLYVIPFSQYHLEKIPPEKIQEFYSKLDSFSKENSVKVYNHLETFQDKKIWSYFDHVAIHPNSHKFNLEFAKIVQEEVKENVIHHT